MVARLNAQRIQDGEAYQDGNNFVGVQAAAARNERKLPNYTRLSTNPSIAESSSPIRRQDLREHSFQDIKGSRTIQTAVPNRLKMKLWKLHLLNKLKLRSLELAGHRSVEESVLRFVMHARGRCDV